MKPQKIAYIFGALNLTPNRLALLENNGYRVTKIHITTATRWFANAVLAVFELEGEPVLTFDTERQKLLKQYKEFMQI